MLESLERWMAARGWRFPPRLVARILVPLAIIGVGEYVFAGRLFGAWTRFAGDLIGLAAAVWVAVAFRRLREAMMIVAAVLLCLAGAEAYALVTLSLGPAFAHTSGHTAPHPVLGWRPAEPGVFHQTKRETATGRVVFDTDYTIDRELDRQVISTRDGPTIAFFGDSFTFGEGLPDEETLPQIFADLTERQFNVLNLAAAGYGPQQFLRPVEVGFFDHLLIRPRAFIFLTAPWHMDRTSCVADYAMPAPRYLLADAMPRFSGRCIDRWSWLIGRLFTMPMYHVFLEPALGGPSAAKLELYVAIMARAGELARAKYGVPTVVPYIPVPEYLAGSGITDAMIMGRLRAAGLHVVDAGLDPAAFPGQKLEIPGDGHPTGTANRARAALLQRVLSDLGLLTN
nr:hypothetical protein Hi04_10k_c1074_00024 [uncultured bacterium]